MILDHLDNAIIYEAIHPGLAQVFEFLRSSDLQGLLDGRMDIDSDRVYAIVTRTSGRGEKKSPLETHDRFIDVHFVVEGRERLGWKPRCLAGASRGYDAAQDLELYEGIPAHYCELEPGQLAVLFPQDAHAPLSGTGPVHKIVVKVKVRD